MTASVQEKGTNYYIVLAWKDDITGKNKTKWEKTGLSVGRYKKDSRVLENLRKEVLQKYYSLYETHKVDFSNDVLFDVYLENWLENLKNSLSIEPTTYDTYKRNIDNRIVPFFKPLKLKVRDITPMHINQFVQYCTQLVYRGKQLKAETIRRYLTTITTCLNSAVNENIIPFNPASRIKKPKKVEYDGAKIYSEQEITELLERSKGDPLEIVILLTVFYGLRRSEVLGLKWDVVNLSDNTIHIKKAIVPGTRQIHEKNTKNESSNDFLYLDKGIKEKLLAWKKQQDNNKSLQPNDYVENGYICTDVKGERLKPNYISQHFQILLKNIGMPHVRFHDLRHSSASYLHSLGFDILKIQIWLRHANINTTRKYIQLGLGARKEMADVIGERLLNKGVLAF